MEQIVRYLLTFLPEALGVTSAARLASVESGRLRGGVVAGLEQAARAGEVPFAGELNPDAVYRALVAALQDEVRELPVVERREQTAALGEKLVEVGERTPESTAQTAREVEDARAARAAGAKARDTVPIDGPVQTVETGAVGNDAQGDVPIEGVWQYESAPDQRRRRYAEALNNVIARSQRYGHHDPMAGLIGVDPATGEASYNAPIGVNPGYVVNRRQERIGSADSMERNSTVELDSEGNPVWYDDDNRRLIVVPSNQIPDEGLEPEIDPRTGQPRVLDPLTGQVAVDRGTTGWMVLRNGKWETFRPNVDGQTRSGVVSVAPRYHSGDQYRHFAGRSPEEIARMQRELVRAGTLTGAFRIGVWDEASSGAYFDILAVANQGGVTAEQALRGMVDAVARDRQDIASELAGMSAEETSTFLRPDYAAIREQVNALFRSELGRDPTSAELASLAAGYMDDWQSQVRAQQDAERQAATLTAQRAMASPVASIDRFLGEDTLAPEEQAALAAPSSIEVQDVDPMSRLVQTFEQRYADRIRARNAQEESTGTRSTLVGSLRNLSQLGS